MVQAVGVKGQKFDRHWWYSLRKRYGKKIHLQFDVENELNTVEISKSNKGDASRGRVQVNSALF